jgi:hypothetical protein
MNVTITLTIEEANYVLAALGARPFGEVVDLITKIKMEAEQQLAKMPSVEAPEPTED